MCTEHGNISLWYFFANDLHRFRFHFISEIYRSLTNHWLEMWKHLMASNNNSIQQKQIATYIFLMDSKHTHTHGAKKSTKSENTWHPNNYYLLTICLAATTCGFLWHTYNVATKKIRNTCTLLHTHRHSTASTASKFVVHSDALGASILNSITDYNNGNRKQLRLSINHGWFLVSVLFPFRHPNAFSIIFVTTENETFYDQQT